MENVLRLENEKISTIVLNSRIAKTKKTKLSWKLTLGLFYICLVAISVFLAFEKWYILAFVVVSLSSIVTVLIYYIKSFANLDISIDKIQDFKQTELEAQLYDSYNRRN